MYSIPAARLYYTVLYVAILCSTLLYSTLLCSTLLYYKIILPGIRRNNKERSGILVTAIYHCSFYTSHYDYYEYYYL